MRIRVGTSGFAYKAWVGDFYPAKTKSADMLGIYAETFSTVEINNTFYRMPRREVIESWAGRVPNDFSLVLKAPRRITHMKKLADCEEPLGWFAEAADALGDKRGPVLFQLPPFLKKDLDRLRAFLEVVPDGIDPVFEFRHASWEDDAVHDAIRDAGATLCTAIKSGDDDDTAALVATSDRGYVRFREDAYDDAILARWLAAIRAEPWSDAWVFFKHDDAGPDVALRFLAMAADGA